MTKDSIKASRQSMEDAIREVGRDPSKKKFHCFNHDEKTASMILSEHGGAWHVKCFGCGWHGDVFDVLAFARKCKPEEIILDMTKPEPARTLPVWTLEQLRTYRTSGLWSEGTFVYTNPDTLKADMVQVRMMQPSGKKTFWCCRPSQGGFVQKAPDKPWPLYNRSRVRSADEVLIVEGEKCVHAAHEAGIIATTSPCGAQSAPSADWSPLAGKIVTLWRDNDENGTKYMQAVVEQLKKLTPPPVVILSIDPDDLNLDAGEDIADYLSSHVTPDAKRIAIAAAMGLATKLEEVRPAGAIEDLDRVVEDTIIGKRRSIPWPYPIIGHQTKALMPSTVTCLCGDPGCGKSLMMLESAWYWHSNNVGVALYELEDNRTYHLYRAMAQLANRSEITDDEWVRQNPEEMRAIMEQFRGPLESFASCIDDAPDTEISHESLLTWVQAKCDADKKIIIIDPITMAKTGKRPWDDDREFMFQAKKIIRHSEARLILVTHPKMGKGFNALTGMAGGASFPRFAHTTLWIHVHNPRKKCRIVTPTGFFDSDTNRTIFIGKARNGAGHGGLMGFNFEGSSLRFAEQGMIDTDKSNKNIEETVDEQV